MRFDKIFHHYFGSGLRINQLFIPNIIAEKVVQLLIVVYFAAPCMTAPEAGRLYVARVANTTNTKLCKLLTSRQARGSLSS